MPKANLCCCFALALLCWSSNPVSAQLTVFLDFTTDSHDGSGGAANGIADWIDELNQATASAGVGNFTSGERTTIEGNIASQLNTIFNDYNITFTTTSPGGTFDTIYFGVEDSPGILGFAPLDVGNLFANQIANVAPESFDFFIESFEPRSQQISEISFGLSGTAAHELGHSLGLLHHFAYSNEGITPATYGATGGLQNNHIIATGSTGLSELGRETMRTLSPFSQVMLDISGGARTVFGGQDNISVVTGGVISDRSEDLGGDAGSTLATAQALTLTTGPTSNREIAFVEADLDGSASDVDVYSFETIRGGSLLAHVFSTDLVYGSGGEFDAMLELLDDTGTVLGSNDDVSYSDDVYNGGTFRDSDPFLVNLDIPTAGTYFFRVTPMAGAEIGSNYWLVAGFQAIPEPSTYLFSALMIGGMIWFTRRKSHMRRAGERARSTSDS